MSPYSEDFECEASQLSYEKTICHKRPSPASFQSWGARAVGIYTDCSIMLQKQKALKRKELRVCMSRRRINPQKNTYRYFETHLLSFVLYFTVECRKVNSEKENIALLQLSHQTISSYLETNYPLNSENSRKLFAIDSCPTSAPLQDKECITRFYSFY